VKSIAVYVLVAIVSYVWVGTACAEWKEGLWEITTKSEMKDIPAQMPATTMRDFSINRSLQYRHGSDEGLAHGVVDLARLDTITDFVDWNAGDG
jgi:hypothetical protein